MNDYSKNGLYKCIAPELMEAGKQYAFSISPADDVQYFNSENSLQRYSNFHKKAITYLLHNLAPYADYDLYIEISEHCRLHLHGNIKVKDVFDFYCMALPRMREYGGYCLKEIKTPEEWDIYVHKCKAVMGNRPRRITSKVAKEVLTTPKFFIEEIKTPEHKPKDKGSRGRPKNIKLSVNLMNP